MEQINSKINNVYCSFFMPKEEIKKVLIAIHGFAGDKESSVVRAIANKLTEKNILVVVFDLPSHGEDNTKLELKECYDYIDRVINHVISSYNNDISFFATSFGGYILLNYLNKTNMKFNNIILRAPAVFMDEILVNKILKEHGYTRNDLNDKKINLGFEKELIIDKQFYNDLLDNKIKDVNNEYFYNIIQGKKDDIVDYKKNEEFFKCKAKNYKFYYLDNAGHRFKNKGELEEIVNIVDSIM